MRLIKRLAKIEDRCEGDILVRKPNLPFGPRTNRIVRIRRRIIGFTIDFPPFVARDRLLNPKPELVLAPMAHVQVKGIVVVESYDDPAQGIREIGQIPRYEGTGIQHLPENVERFFSQAQTALRARLADSAAVELRRTLEAACAARGHKKKTLVASIKSLVDEGLITTEFTPALAHVRKIGNAGAHATDEELLVDEVRLTMRFTEQVLRNLFEIPGELKLLEGDGSERGSDG